MKKIFLKATCFALMLFLLEANLASCFEASQFAKLEETEKAIELYRLSEEKLNKMDSFVTENTMNIVARISNKTTSVAATGETTVFDLNGESFSHYTEIKTDMEIGTTKEKVTTVSINGYSDGKMFISNSTEYKDEEKTTEKKLWSNTSKEEYIEYLSSRPAVLALDITKDSCNSFSCVQGEDKGWTATYTGFTKNALLQINELLDRLDKQFDEGHDLVDIKMTLKTDKKFLPVSIDLEFMYEDNDGDRREDAPVITMSSIYKSFNEIEAAKEISLDGFSEVDDLKLIYVAEQAIYDKINSQDVSIKIKNYQEIKNGAQSNTAESTITGKYTCVSGIMAYNITSAQGDDKTIVTYANKSKTTKFTQKNVVKSTKTEESDNKTEYAFIESLINSGALSLTTISDITVIDKEKGIYEFDISDYMMDILRASTSADVTIEGKTTATLTIADGELIKYDFYSEYSVFARETNKTTALTTTKCTFE